MFQWICHFWKIYGQFWYLRIVRLVTKLIDEKSHKRILALDFPLPLILVLLIINTLPRNISRYPRLHPLFAGLRVYMLLFSGESCDVTPITSVAPPIPRTPTPGDPPVQTFSVQNGNTDCIVLQAAIEFIIPYTSKGAVSVNVEICFLMKMNYPIIM